MQVQWVLILRHFHRLSKTELNVTLLYLLTAQSISPIINGKDPSLIMNQFFDNPNFAPKIPIPPVSKILINPMIDIKFIFFLLNNFSVSFNF